MNGVAIASILVSAVAAVGGWLSARESRKANTTNSTTSGRVEMEKEAYERARKLDTETIERQEHELDELRRHNDKLTERVEAVQGQNQQLNEDVARISRDNYDLHRENTRIIEMNEQILTENKRLRREHERIFAANSQLSTEVGSLRSRVTKLQRGMDPETKEPIREREDDTSPMIERQGPHGRE